VEFLSGEQKKMAQNAESLYVWGLPIGILLYIVMNGRTVSEQQTRRDWTESAYNGEVLPAMSKVIHKILDQDSWFTS